MQALFLRFIAATLTLFSMTTMTTATPLSDAYVGLRNMALTAKAEEILNRKATPHEVYGVLFEMGFKPAVVTVLCMADGSTSLYTSSGGGYLGLQSNKDVASAARAFLAKSKLYQQSMTKASDFPVPAVDRVRFYLLTADGVLTSETNVSDIQAVGSPLNPLWDQGQRLIFEIQKASK